MIPIDINKDLPYFQQKRLTQEQIDAAREDGMVLIHDSPKGKIWYKLPIKEVEVSPEGTKIQYEENP